MDAIELRGLTFYGYHGALPEERVLGQRFVVDLRLGLDVRAAGVADDLALTVDYGQVAAAVRDVVEGPPYKLIEALAEAVAAAAFRCSERIERVVVRVAKPSAPVGAAASGTIAVEIERERPERAGAAPAAGARAVTLPSGAVLSADAIRALQASDAPLVEGLEDPEQQIQPNGVDLTLESIWRVAGAGAIGRSDAERRIPEREAVEPGADGWFALGTGAYVIRLREVVALPRDVMALGRPRSSLLRCAAAIHTAVWDAGYRGRSEALLVVHDPAGLRLAVGARVLQLVFARLDGPTHPYAGRYQGENLASP